jgi:hypothetical protein
MALIHVNAQTATSPVVLLTVQQSARPQTAVSIYNGHSASIFVGDSSIATSGVTIGRTIPAATSQTFYVSGGDVLYGISAAASAAGAIVCTYSA